MCSYCSRELPSTSTSTRRGSLEVLSDLRGRKGFAGVTTGHRREDAGDTTTGRVQRLACHRATLVSQIHHHRGDVACVRSLLVEGRIDPVEPRPHPIYE
jgi:hypothetical protein